MIAQSPFVIQEPQLRKGCWNQLFRNHAPIEIEVGMGKGRFIMELAKNHPDINYIGIERYSSVLLRALQKRQDLEQSGVHLSNIYFLCVDAKMLDQFFASGEVSRIYLNFLSVYEKILAPEGMVEFKTDNRGLFEYSLESIPAAGWKISEQTFDLHHSPMAEGNVMTEYEAKFSAEGKPICKLTAMR